MLTDPEKRDIYDKYGTKGLKEPQGSGDPFDLINQMFGGGMRGG